MKPGSVQGCASGPTARSRPPAAGAMPWTPGILGCPAAPARVAHRRQPDRVRPGEACATGCRHRSRVIPRVQIMIAAGPSLGRQTPTGVDRY